MSPNQESLSLAIVNWNTRDLLRACLLSLRVEAQRLPLDIIVVDNASQDRSVETLKPEFPDVTWIENAQNMGFAAATNQALKRARGTYWGLLNPDTEILPGALERLVQALTQFSDAAVAGPCLLNSDRSIQPSGRRFPGIWRTWGEAFLPNGFKRTSLWTRWVYGRTDFTRGAVVDELSGACFVAQRDVFQRIGFLDERFFLYFEEVDWFKRAQALGYRATYVPEAKVVHHWGAGSKQAPAFSVLQTYQSSFYYWRKHHGPFAAWLIRMTAFKQAGLRVLVRLLKTLLGLEAWNQWGAFWQLQAKVMRLAWGGRV